MNEGSDGIRLPFSSEILFNLRFRPFVFGNKSLFPQYIIALLQPISSIRKMFFSKNIYRHRHFFPQVCSEKKHAPAEKNGSAGEMPGPDCRKSRPDFAVFVYYSMISNSETAGPGLDASNGANVMR